MAKDFAFKSGNSEHTVTYHEGMTAPSSSPRNDRWGKPRGKVVARADSYQGALAKAKKLSPTKLIDAQSEFGHLYYPEGEDHPHHGGNFYEIHPPKGEK